MACKTFVLNINAQEQAFVAQKVFEIILGIVWQEDVCFIELLTIAVVVYLVDDKVAI
ncbi:MAG: hypothetical protein K6G44_10650 [Lentisphaeria bacterium]|nr:hypothetical protein [Lentisphaeria bacterium]